MKICIVVHDYLPDSTRVTAKMMHELAIELKRIGNEVTVITPGYEIKTKFSKETMDGISILRFKSGLINSKSKLIRLINENLLSFRAWFYLKKELKNHHHDLIIFWSPSIFWGPLIRKLKRIWNAKTFFIVRDFFPHWLYDNNQLSKNSPLAYYFQYFERLCYSVSDKIGVQSPNNIKWFRENINTENELVTLFNWVSDSKTINKTNKFRTKHNLLEKIIYFYGGNIGPAQDLSSILKLANSFEKNKNVHFVLIGAGFDYENIEKLILSEKLDNVTLLPAVPQDDFLEILSECDVGLLCLNKLHTTHNFPGKLLNYLVLAKPILGAINRGNDLKEVIENCGNGFISIAGDDKQLYENAVLLLSKELRDQMGKKSKILLKEKFSVETAASTILTSFDKNLK